MYQLGLRDINKLLIIPVNIALIFTTLLSCLQGYYFTIFVLPGER